MGVVGTARAAAAVAAASPAASWYSAPPPPRLTLCQWNAPHSIQNVRRRGATRPAEIRVRNRIGTPGQLRPMHADGGVQGWGKQPRSEARTGGREERRKRLRGRGTGPASSPRRRLAAYTMRETTFVSDGRAFRTEVRRWREDRDRRNSVTETYHKLSGGLLKAHPSRGRGAPRPPMTRAAPRCPAPTHLADNPWRGGRQPGRFPTVPHLSRAAG